MSQLQIALAGLALVVLVGIFAWGKWDERRARARMEDLHAGVGDPLMGEGAPVSADDPAGTETRVEPSLGAMPAVAGEAAPAAPVPTTTRTA